MAFGSAFGVAVAGSIFGLFVGGVAGGAVAIACVTIGLGAALLLLFLEVGMSEDRDRAGSESGAAIASGGRMTTAGGGGLLDCRAMPETASFGSWRSPITAELVARAGTRLSEPLLGPDGSAWWLEGRPAEGGRTVLVRARPGQALEDVTPEGSTCGPVCTVRRRLLAAARRDGLLLELRGPAALPAGPGAGAAADHAGRRPPIRRRPRHPRRAADRVRPRVARRRRGGQRDRGHPRRRLPRAGGAGRRP